MKSKKAVHDAAAFLCRLSDSFALLTLLASIVTLLASYHWIADLLANLRVQQSMAVLVVFVLCLFCRRWLWTAILGLCLLNHAWWFAAPVSTDSKHATMDGDLSITFANVLTANKSYEAIIPDLFADEPDVIVIVELSSVLADRLKAKMSATHPFTTLYTEDRGNFGIGLVSRYPLANIDRFTLNTDIQSIAATIQLPRGRSVRLFATHPLPPIGESNFRLRNEQLTLLAARIKAFTSKQAGTPIVLVGDFNLTPWSPHFNDFQSATRLQRVGSRFDLTPTWYHYPLFPFGLVIDHVMISSDIVCSEHRIGRLTGSDHRRVSVVLDVN